MSLRYASIAEVPQHLLKNREQMRVVPEKQKRKYKNQPVVVDGIRFDSQLEARCKGWLDLRWKAGDVLWHTRQVPFRLEGGVVYRADFVAALKGGGVEVIDATGMMTQAKANKLKQMKARYGIDVIVWTGKP